ncbi:MAG: ABC transporter permease [bacterium]
MTTNKYSFSAQKSKQEFACPGFTFLFFTTVGLGIFISTPAETQQQAMFIAWFFMIFLLLFGFLTPIANLPLAWQKVTYLNPLRYYINLPREIFLKAAPLKFLWNEIVPLGVSDLTILAASALKFHKRVS